MKQHIKDYYSHCYGIRVLDELTVHDFFSSLNEAIPSAEKCAESSVAKIRKVIYEGHSFDTELLKVENSFFEIVASIAAIGLSIDDARVVAALGMIIDTKTELTTDYNAWEQYEHLARWLIYLASILELQGTSIEKTFLVAVLRSMTTMRKELYIGYSWHAYKSWSNRWSGIMASNRMLIKTHIEAHTDWSDALAVVKRG